MKALFPIINSVIRGFAEVLGPLFKFAGMLTANETVMSLLKVTVVGLVAALLAYKAYQLAANVLNGTSGILNRGKDAAAGAIQGFRTGGVRGAIGGLVGGAFGAGGLGKPDGSANNPYYVIVVPGPGGLANALPGAGGGLGGGRTGGTGRVLGSLGNLGVGNLAKGAGVIGAVVGLASLAGDLSSISERKKKGELSEEQAKTETGGAVGSAAGSAGGALAGAAAGAALGSVVPVLGTAIGGVLGGVVGGLAGSSVGKSIGEWFSTSGKKESDRVREQESEKQKKIDQAKSSAENSSPIGKAMQDLILAGNTAKLNQPFGSQFGKAGEELFKTTVGTLPSMSGASKKLAALSPEEAKAKQNLENEESTRVVKSPMEVIQTEMQILNRNIADMLKFTKEMTDHTKRTMDGVAKLNPNLFAR
jgi:hypothetical protein